MPAPARNAEKAKKPATGTAASGAASSGAAASKSPRPLKAGDHLFLVDGSGYIFRAYHALPPLTRKSDGLQVNAVLGFCNMLWKLLREMPPDNRPTHLAVVFDKSEKTFRTDMYTEYKANRSAPPDDLIPQFPLVREAVRAFDIPCLEQAGFEADDLIATYARLACEARATTTIVSSDKDLMQLVCDTVTLYDTMKDKRIGRTEVIEKFGVGPEKVIEVQSLIGDTSDNVPGVPGIGVKTAAQLIIEYGDLETLLKRAGEIKQEKRRQSLIDHAEAARLSKKLVTLDQHVALDVPAADLAVHDPDYRNLIAFLKAMEFTTLTRRVVEQSGVDASGVEPNAKVASHEVAITSPPPPAASAPAGQFDFGDTPQPVKKPVPAGVRTPAGTEPARDPVSLAQARAAKVRAMPFDRSRYQTIRTLDELEAWVARIRERGVVAVATESTDPDPMKAELCGFSLAVSPSEARYVPIGHRDGAAAGTDLFVPEPKLASGQIAARDALAAMRPLLEDSSVLKIGQDIKRDWLILSRHGIDMQSYDDVTLMSYVVDAGRGGHDMDDLATKWLGRELPARNTLTGSGKSQVTFDRVTIEKASEHAAERADVALRLWLVLKPRMAADHVATVYETLERPLVPVLARMERRGISIDRQVLSRLSGEFAQKQGGLEDEINRLAGEPVNPGSPKVLGDILFGKMGLPGGTKTKTGQWATGAKVLEDLAEQGHELPQKILDWRQVSKLRSTYTDALPDYVNPETKRVHTSYALAATTTGRLSSSDPNLQNIPIRTEEGRKIRTAFVAGQGHKLVSADYSQIELRLLAEVADVPALRKAFRDGLDIHAMTASEMFGVPIKNMPGEVRRRAKAINFGIIYGISAFGLANQLGIEREEAGAYIKKYFERFPGIRDYMEETKAFAKQHGHVLTLFGRKCHYPDIVNSNASIRAFNERAAINARLQGSAADIIRRAMVRVEPALAKARLNAQMLLQVHDELIFEVPDGEVDRTLPIIKSVMEEAPMPAVALHVPLSVEARAAGNWEEAH
jgi:DNA polymerase-1